MLSFDQVMFFAGLHVAHRRGRRGAGRRLDRQDGRGRALQRARRRLSALAASGRCAGARSAPRIADVFDTLTYRERYEDLLARTGRDALTGALDRGRLEAQGAQHDRGRRCWPAGRSASCSSTSIISRASTTASATPPATTCSNASPRASWPRVRTDDLVFRFGGEEFVVICDGMAADAGARARRAHPPRGGGRASDGAAQVTVSVGIASRAPDAADYDGMFALADRRLYQAKAAGRNCVIGERVASVQTPVRLVHAN